MVNSQLAAQAAAEDFVDALLNDLPVAAFRVDLDGVTRHANRAAEALLKLDHSSLAGARYDQPVLEVSSPDGEPLDFTVSPVPRALAGQTVTAFKAAVRLPGETEPRILSIDAAPFHDRDGTIAGALVAARDVTAQHMAERALKLSQRRLNSVLNNTTMAVFVMDEQQHCIYANAAAEALTGYAFAEMQGRPLHNVVHHTHPDGRHYPLEECPIDRAFPDKFQVQGEEMFVHKDGSFYPVAFTASPIQDEESKTVGTVLEVRGISDERQREAQRRESEERYRLAISATRDAIWDWDLKRDHVLWNEALQQAHGHDLETVEPTGGWWLSHIHPEDRDRVDRSIHAVIDGGGSSWSEEYRFQRADGSYADVLDRGTVLRDANGAAVRMIGAMLDLTEQKRQQAALQESEATLRSLTEAMPNMAWITRSDGSVEWFNARWYEYIGSEPGKDLGDAWVSYLHPDDRERALQKWQAAAAGGEPFENEHRFRAADGSYRWFLARGTPIRTSEGGLTRWFGTCTDIQDMVEARDVLARSREELMREVADRTRELNRIWNISEDLFVVCERDGRCRTVNPGWTSALGYRTNDIIGRRFEAFVHPDDMERFELALEQLARTGSVRDADIRLRTKTGGYRWYTWNCIAEGDVFYGSGRDVTQRMELEAQLRQSQKMETVGKLTGGVAHDFNNLLQVISGNLQLLLKDVAGSPRAEIRVQNALAGVSRGSKLASQLLAFGRRQPLEPKVVNVGRLITGMEDMLRRSLGEAVEVETIISGGLWNTVIDPAQVENALLNLAINARDAMDGAGKLTIEAGNAYLDDAYARSHAEVTPGQYVVVAVTDTGCGMSPEVLAQVFEPFFSTKPEGKGTGLGLSMVYGFVKQSGGHVKIYSEPGQGTTVKIYLPRSTAAEDVLVAADTGPVKGGEETILVAEDDEEVRATAVEMLSDLGYRVLKAKDAASALSIIESGIPIDVLFTDVVMPGELRSPELARKAKERLPNLAVLFTSGYTENAIVHGGRLDPGVELIGKPYTQEALGRKIRHVIANQRQRAQVIASKSAPPSREPAPESSPLSRRTVLLVEDDDLIRSNTAEMLQNHGQVVVEAANAEEALLALQTTTIDVLVTDLGLPGTTGDVLAARARELRPGLGLIFATGTDQPAGSPDGAILLRKPYDSAALGQALRRVASTAQEEA